MSRSGVGTGEHPQHLVDPDHQDDHDVPSFTEEYDDGAESHFGSSDEPRDKAETDSGSDFLDTSDDGDDTSDDEDGNGDDGDGDGSGGGLNHTDDDPNWSNPNPPLDFLQSVSGKCSQTMGAFAQFSLLSLVWVIGGAEAGVV